MLQHIVILRAPGGRGVPIYRVGKILAANMEKFQKLVFFEIVQIYLPILLHAPII